MTEHIVDLSQLASIRDGTGHTIFSPSSSPMWLWCAGSLIPNLLAEDTAGRDAARGTVAHGLTEEQLRTGKVAHHRVGEKVFIQQSPWGWGYMIEITGDMLGYVQDAVDYCEWQVGDHFIETRNDFSKYTPIPNQSGTADHAVCSPGLMVITDHKFGTGVRVDAAIDRKDPRTIVKKDGVLQCNGNSQGLLYALGFFLKYDHLYHFKRIVIRISQPLLDHYDEWETTREELLRFGEFVRERAAAAWQINAPRRPSEKACLWCKIKTTCAAKAAQEEALLAGALDEVGGDIPESMVADMKQRLADGPANYSMNIAPLSSLTTKEMATLYKFRSAAEKWWRELGAELLRRADNGETVPGFKTVESRSNRVFVNEKRVISILKAHGVPEDQIIETSIVSPSRAEELLLAAGVRSKDLQEVLKPVVRKPPGRPTLAPDTDKRMALEDMSENAFRD